MKSSLSSQSRLAINESNWSKSISREIPISQHKEFKHSNQVLQEVIDCSIRRASNEGVTIDQNLWEVIDYNIKRRAMKGL